MLTIYRIQKSEIIKNYENIILDASNGLTVNPGIIYSKQLKNNRELSFLFAFPIIDRAYRADGLTRNIVFGLRITLIILLTIKYNYGIHLNLFNDFNF